MQYMPQQRLCLHQPLTLATLYCLQVCSQLQKTLQSNRINPSPPDLSPPPPGLHL